jgi:hypothetical protein
MNIPCKECISFAICKQKVTAMKIPDITRFSLFAKCHYIEKYVDDLDNYRIPEYVIQINKVRDLYGLKPTKVGEFE